MKREVSVEAAENLATTIVLRSMGQRATRSAAIIGHGDVNSVVRVTTDQSEVIVRLRDEENALAEFRKEQWCIVQAARAGIPGPLVRQVGTIGTVAFMIESFVEGVYGPNSGDLDAIWYALGQFAKTIHCLPVSGFGDQLDDATTGRFRSIDNRSWPGFIERHIKSLTTDDPLLLLGVYGPEEQSILREHFLLLAAQRFVFGLCHGDLTSRNVIVASSGEIVLLDWGCAEVHIVPHFELVETFREDEPHHTAIGTAPPARGEVHAFLNGYGLTPHLLGELAPQVATLYVLKMFDLVRNAMEHRPADVAEYAARAARALRDPPRLTA
ncbi:MAG TPA: aminoglycoside phosphotransferase family protein [Candidatus Limnocylindrales bacterium]|nr:aminoglycoside phosphotransferase family protein [Candidatus Limnocylindrales bacterium]